MVPTDRQNRPTLRLLLFGQECDDELNTRMRSRLPMQGIINSRRINSRALPRATTRLVDNRILAASLQFIDQDADILLVTGLKRAHSLVEAAHTTLTAPGKEILVTLVESYKVHYKQQPEVALIVDNKEVARVEFDLTALFTMGETAVSVCNGAITAIQCQAGKLTAALAIRGGSTLLQGSASFPLQKQIRPPISIPVIAPSRRAASNRLDAMARPHSESGL